MLRFYKTKVVESESEVLREGMGELGLGLVANVHNKRYEGSRSRATWGSVVADARYRGIFVSIAKIKP